MLKQNAGQMVLGKKSRSDRAGRFSQQVEHGHRALVGGLRCGDVDSANMIDSKAGFAGLMSNVERPVDRRSLERCMFIEATLDLWDVMARHIGVAAAKVRLRDLNGFGLPLNGQSGGFENSGGELRSHDSEVVVVFKSVATELTESGSS